MNLKIKGRSINIDGEKFITLRSVTNLLLDISVEAELTADQRVLLRDLMLLFREVDEKAP